MLRGHLYHWKELVIGENLNAIIYANQHSTKILALHEPTILPFDKFCTSYDLGLKSINEGDSKYELVRELTFKAAIDGQHPFADNLVSIKITPEENQVKVVTKNGSVVHIEYEKLRIFNPEGIQGIPFEINERTDNYKVIDWFDVRSGAGHKFDFLEDPENSFVNKIYFYLSERIDGNVRYKDLASESILTKQELHSPDYSDTVARLKTISMMKEAGINGQSNGVRQFLPIRLELYHREVIPNKAFDFVEEGNIIVDNRTEENVLNEWISSCRNSASSRATA